MIRKDADERMCFLSTLEWLMAVTVRYGSPVQFGLVHIACGHKNQLGEAYGAQEAAHQLVAVIDSLKKAFRKTDLVARNGSDLWVIVPFTPSTEKLHDKVIEILESAKHDGLNVVDREVSIFNLTNHLSELDKQIKEFNALSLLEYLEENKKTLAQYTFELSSSPALT